MCRRGNRQNVSSTLPRKSKKPATSSGFAECCVCNRNISRHILESHVNLCLDRSTVAEQSHNDDLESHLSRAKQATDSRHLALAPLNRVSDRPDDGAVGEHQRVLNAHECGTIKCSTPCSESSSQNKEKSASVSSVPQQMAQSSRPGSSEQVHEEASAVADMKCKLHSTHESQQWPVSSSSPAVEPSIRKEGKEDHQTGSMTCSLTGPLYKSGVAASLPPLKSPLNFLARESMQQPRIAACFRRACEPHGAVTAVAKKNDGAFSRGSGRNGSSPESNGSAVAVGEVVTDSLSTTGATATVMVLREGYVVPVSPCHRGFECCRILFD